MNLPTRLRQSRLRPPRKTAYSNKPICKRVAVTGSYVKRTVCKTQEQIDRDQAAMDQWAQDIKRNGSWNTVNADH